MGLYSTVINSCELLGEELSGSLQTKDLEDCFNLYWIDPAGHLFLIDYSGCSELVPKEPEDEPMSFFPMKWKPTGANGRIYPVMARGWVRLYNGIYETNVFLHYGRVAGITQPVEYRIKLTDLTADVSSATLQE